MDQNGQLRLEAGETELNYAHLNTMRAGTEEANRFVVASVKASLSTQEADYGERVVPFGPGETIDLIPGRNVIVIDKGAGRKEVIGEGAQSLPVATTDITLLEESLVKNSRKVNDGFKVESGELSEEGDSLSASREVDYPENLLVAAGIKGADHVEQAESSSEGVRWYRLKGQSITQEDKKMFSALSGISLSTEEADFSYGKFSGEDLVFLQNIESENSWARSFSDSQYNKVTEGIDNPQAVYSASGLKIGQDTKVSFLPGRPKVIDLAFVSSDGETSRDLYVKGADQSGLQSFNIDANNFSITGLSGASEWEILNHFVTVNKYALSKTTVEQNIYIPDSDRFKDKESITHLASQLKELGIEDAQRISETIISQGLDNLEQNTVIEMAQAMADTNKDIVIPDRLTFDLLIDGSREEPFAKFILGQESEGDREVLPSGKISLSFLEGEGFGIKHGKKEDANWFPYFSQLDALRYAKIDREDIQLKGDFSGIQNDKGSGAPQPLEGKIDTVVEVKSTGEETIWFSNYQTREGKELDPLSLHVQLPQVSSYKVVEDGTSLGIAGLFGEFSKGTEINFLRAKNGDGRYTIKVKEGAVYTPYFSGGFSPKTELITDNYKDEAGVAYEGLRAGQTYIFADSKGTLLPKNAVESVEDGEVTYNESFEASHADYYLNTELFKQSEALPYNQKHSVWNPATNSFITAFDVPASLDNIPSHILRSQSPAPETLDGDPRQIDVSGRNKITARDADVYISSIDGSQEGSIRTISFKNLGTFTEAPITLGEGDQRIAFSSNYNIFDSTLMPASGLPGVSSVIAGKAGVSEFLNSSELSSVTYKGKNINIGEDVQGGILASEGSVFWLSQNQGLAGGFAFYDDGAGNLQFGEGSGFIEKRKDDQALQILIGRYTDQENTDLYNKAIQLVYQDSQITAKTRRRSGGEIVKDVPFSQGKTVVLYDPDSESFGQFFKGSLQGDIFIPERKEGKDSFKFFYQATASFNNKKAWVHSSQLLRHQSGALSQSVAKVDWSDQKNNKGFIDTFFHKEAQSQDIEGDETAPAPYILGQQKTEAQVSSLADDILFYGAADSQSREGSLFLNIGGLNQASTVNLSQAKLKAAGGVSGFQGEEIITYDSGDEISFDQHGRVKKGFWSSLATFPKDYYNAARNLGVHLAALPWIITGGISDIAGLDSLEEYSSAQMKYLAGVREKTLKGGAAATSVVDNIIEGPFRLADVAIYSATTGTGELFNSKAVTDFRDRNSIDPYNLFNERNVKYWDLGFDIVGVAAVLRVLQVLRPAKALRVGVATKPVLGGIRATKSTIAVKLGSKILPKASRGWQAFAGKTAITGGSTIAGAGGGLTYNRAVTGQWGGEGWQRHMAIGAGFGAAVPLAIYSGHYLVQKTTAGLRWGAKTKGVRWFANSKFGKGAHWLAGSKVGKVGKGIGRFGKWTTTQFVPRLTAYGTVLGTVDYISMNDRQKAYYAGLSRGQGRVRDFGFLLGQIVSFRDTFRSMAGKLHAFGLNITGDKEGIKKIRAIVTGLDMEAGLIDASLIEQSKGLSSYDLNLLAIPAQLLRTVKGFASFPHHVIDNTGKSIRGYRNESLASSKYPNLKAFFDYPAGILKGASQGAWGMFGFLFSVGESGLYAVVPRSLAGKGQENPFYQGAVQGWLKSVIGPKFTEYIDPEGDNYNIVTARRNGEEKRYYEGLDYFLGNLILIPNMTQGLGLKRGKGGAHSNFSTAKGKFGKAGKIISVFDRSLVGFSQKATSTVLLPTHLLIQAGKTPFQLLSGVPKAVGGAFKGRPLASQLKAEYRISTKARKTGLMGQTWGRAATGWFTAFTGFRSEEYRQQFIRNNPKIFTNSSPIAAWAKEHGDKYGGLPSKYVDRNGNTFELKVTQNNNLVYTRASNFELTNKNYRPFVSSTYMGGEAKNNGGGGNFKGNNKGVSDSKPPKNTFFRRLINKSKNWGFGLLFTAATVFSSSSANSMPSNKALTEYKISQSPTRTPDRTADPWSLLESKKGNTFDSRIQKNTDRIQESKSTNKVKENKNTNKLPALKISNIDASIYSSGTSAPSAPKPIPFSNLMGDFLRAAGYRRRRDPVFGDIPSIDGAAAVVAVREIPSSLLTGASNAVSGIMPASRLVYKKQGIKGLWSYMRGRSVAPIAVPKITTKDGLNLPVAQFKGLTIYDASLPQ
ncbi:MAG: hypothetical protein K9L61_05245, partial [Candidatus Omnitrophica bacterium]|nr:hypothetical protein [Candidatus Omnitrophota bacterium]